MLLRAYQIRKSYGEQQVLRGVDLDLASGHSLALTGESGSGKSTLIHIMAGLDVPDGGSVEIDGLDLADLSESKRAKLRRMSIGIVFQQYNLIPSMNARDNLSFQADVAGRPGADWVEQLAIRLGLTDHLSKYPEELSGGQQQRVAIGRALAVRPRLVFADEPTGNLDEATADATLALLKELVVTSGAGLVMATHSTARAATLDRVVHLSGGMIW